MKYLLLITTVLCSLCLRAQNAPQGLWVGEEYECVLRNLIGDLQPVDISWGIDNQHKDYFFVEENDNVYIIKPSRYFYGIATITCNYSVIMDGISIQYPPVQWSFTCIDNPISLMPTTLSLEVGKTVRPFQYSHENELYANEAMVSFESEGSAIEVTPDGEVHAIQPGTAKVYARSNLSKEKSNPCIITVTDSQVPEFAISFDQGNMTIERGESRDLYVTVTPSDAEYTINWKTSDPGVATVKKDPNNKNKASVTAKGKGQATISATIDGTDVKATCDITVTITPTSIQMPQRNYALYVGEKMTVQPIVKPEDADYSLSWRSNDSEIAVVDTSTGEVTAKTVGTARITATIAGTNLSDYYNINVDKPTLTLSASPSGGVVNFGSSVTLKANIDDAFIWYTTDGSTPSETNGKLYQKPILINQACKIKAIAVHPNYYSSDILTANFKIRTIPGDVNEDNETNIADINAIINIVLSGADDLLRFQLADINNDGEVNIADINAVIDIILNPEKYLTNVETFTVNGVSFRMVSVEGGTFTMGRSGNGSYDRETPAHQVTLSGYSIAQTEVTQALWLAVMGENPSSFTGNLQLPVERVSWYECQQFISKLNELTGRAFRLPTEAEWEFAARGGNKSQDYTYAGSNNIKDVAWYLGNSESQTHPVAMMIPNELGIYDMNGNVDEWCSDWGGYYTSEPQFNPTGPTTSPSSGPARVFRGGHWNTSENNCRVYSRLWGLETAKANYIGFRLALGEETFSVKGVSFKMVHVDGGTFIMGDSIQHDGLGADVIPAHEVTLSDFSIGQTEVTQDLWEAVMGSNPSKKTGDKKRPVENVCWSECQTFIEKLNELTGMSFRLPTEAEWEFAACGGNKSKHYLYSGSNIINDVAWYDQNSMNTTHPVKRLSPNELGLYDMSGNVEEWCLDWYDGYNSQSQTNPTGPSGGSERVVRGGSWWGSSKWCCNKYRYSNSLSYNSSFIGLRLAMGYSLMLEQTKASLMNGRTVKIRIFNGTKNYTCCNDDSEIASYKIEDDYLIIKGEKVGTASITVIDNSTKAKASIIVNVRPAPISITINDLSFKMILVDGGTFLMGATEEQINGYDDEIPVHEVTLSDYCIGETEVTQELWHTIMGNNPSEYTGTLQLPVENVSWDDCQMFISKLNEMAGLSFRLPTEAEWEFAARGGKGSKGYVYAGSNELENVAWYRGKSGNKTHPIACKLPNELGLYDMSGNVSEWCQDWYGRYSDYSQTNPIGSPSGDERVFRGGSWHNGASDCRVTTRQPELTYSIGLRLATSNTFMLERSFATVGVGKSTTIGIQNGKGNYTYNIDDATKVDCRIENENIIITGKNPGSTTIKIIDTKTNNHVCIKVLSQNNKRIEVNNVSFDMVYVEGGNFKMGADSVDVQDVYQNGADWNEIPNHEVYLSQYYIGKTEVTQQLWETVMGSNPSIFKGDKQLPVDNVSWDDCQMFISKLSEMTGLSFRLPTEAEWEYAARGGSLSQSYMYSGSNNLDDVSWYADNSFYCGSINKDYGTHNVATKDPNELGIFDMTGNVKEWCLDWYGSYPEGSQYNPLGPEDGEYHVMRGGCWKDSKLSLRVSKRDDGFFPTSSRGDRYGLRLVLTL